MMARYLLYLPTAPGACRTITRQVHSCGRYFYRRGYLQRLIINIPSLIAIRGLKGHRCGKSTVLRVPTAVQSDAARQVNSSASRLRRPSPQPSRLWELVHHRHPHLRDCPSPAAPLPPGPLPLPRCLMLLPSKTDRLDQCNRFGIRNRGSYAGAGAVQSAPYCASYCMPGQCKTGKLPLRELHQSSILLLRLRAHKPFVGPGAH